MGEWGKEGLWPLTPPRQQPPSVLQLQLPCKNSLTKELETWLKQKNGCLASTEFKPQCCQNKQAKKKKVQRIH
jgi:hypothetical protein